MEADVIQYESSSMQVQNRYSQTESMLMIEVRQHLWNFNEIKYLDKEKINITSLWFYFHLETNLCLQVWIIASCFDIY